MDIKLTKHARNTISLLYKQKAGWNSNIGNFFKEKKTILAYISLQTNNYTLGVSLRQVHKGVVTPQEEGSGRRGLKNWNHNKQHVRFEILCQQFHLLLPLTKEPD